MRRVGPGRRAVWRRGLGPVTTTPSSTPCSAKGLGPAIATFQEVTAKFADTHHRRSVRRHRSRTWLAEVKDQCLRRRHHPIPEQGRWLASVVRGHLAYYAVPGNSEAIGAFRNQAIRHWFKALRRRSQRTRLTWERMYRLAARWLPPAHILHPYPRVRFDARTQGRSPVR